MSTPPRRPPVFHLREGRSPQRLLMFAFLLFTVVLITVGLARSGDRSVGSAAILLGFLAALLAVGTSVVRQAWSFRVDAHGLTTRDRSLRQDHRRHLAWDQVLAIVLWKSRNTTYLGVIPVPGALPPRPAPTSSWAARYATPPEAHFLQHLNGGQRPSLRRLSTVLSEVAPHVALIDHRPRQSVVHLPGDGRYLPARRLP